jgi:membrane fusion protein (multidrug efflux system)
MNRRGIVTTTVIIIAAGIIIGKVLNDQKKPVRKIQRPDKRNRVNTIQITKRDISTNITLTGQLKAFDRVEVYSEVSGVLLPTEKRFRPGSKFEKGEPLIQVDDRVYHNNLLARKSGLLNQLTLLLPDLSIDFPQNSKRWRNYLENFDLHKSLAPLPEVGSDKERYYIASRNIYNEYYSIKSMEVTLSKYTIRAPYQGVVTEGSINPGTLVRQGQELGVFTSTEMYEMEAFAKPEEVNLLSVDKPVMLTSTDLPGTFEGRIDRINEVIDPRTQMIAVYITTADRRLKDGMYMEANIESNPIKEAARIPRGSISGNGRVWVARDSILTTREITIAAVENDHVIVQGLPNGTVVVLEPPEGAKEGIKINVPKLAGGGGGPPTGGASINTQQQDTGN